jgi:glycosyltransferase involved in cell wall biosynthesis
MQQNMKLSIITINWNNAEGLRKTMKSVLTQSCKEFEYIVVDGGSTDGGVDIIKQYEDSPNLRWLSEKDNGIYNAMNKGIKMAHGEYLHFLNSGDCLIDQDVVRKMLAEVERNNHPDIMIGSLYRLEGNKTIKDQIIYKDSTLWSLYSSAPNHPAAYVRRKLFEKYGLYDEGLRIVSDWKWFLKVIVWGNMSPVYVDVDVTLFDTNGISESNVALLREERSRTLKEEIPPKILADYDKYGIDIRMMQRIRRHKWAYGIVYFIERMLFKMEKRKVKRGGRL